MVSQTPIIDKKQDHPELGQENPKGEQAKNNGGGTTADFQPSTGKDKGRTSKYGDDHFRNTKNFKWPIAETWAELGMLAVAIPLALFAVWQLSLLNDANATARVSADAAKAAAIAAKKSVVVASETAQKQLSAYVLPTKAEILGLNGPGAMVVRVTVKNSGQTPAFNASVSVDTWWEEIPRQPPVAGVLPTKEGAQITLAAGEDAEIDHQVGEPRRRELKARRAILHLAGAARYDDIFGHTHESTFHFVQGGKSDPAAPKMTLIESGYSDSVGREGSTGQIPYPSAIPG